jgi:tetratricopeptide (TPR) repeat protein
MIATSTPAVRRHALIALLLLFTSREVLGQASPHTPPPSAEDSQRARAYFEAGRALYSLGRYEDALPAFTAGYQLVHRPEFLINLGQTYRRLGRLDEAKAMFTRFLAEAPASDPFRAEVTQILDEIERTNEHPRPAIEAAPSEHTLRAPAAPVAATPVTVAPIAAAPRPTRPFLRRHWWIIPVTGIALAGLAVGIYFAARPSIDCGAAGLGCVDGAH